MLPMKIIKSISEKWQTMQLAKSRFLKGNDYCIAVTHQTLTKQVSWVISKHI
jgi:hypothetical protein